LRGRGEVGAADLVGKKRSKEGCGAIGSGFRFALYAQGGRKRGRAKSMLVIADEPGATKDNHLSKDNNTEGRGGEGEDICQIPTGSSAIRD